MQVFKPERNIVSAYAALGVMTFLCIPLILCLQGIATLILIVMFVIAAAFVCPVLLSILTTPTVVIENGIAYIVR